jgi:hypothetical protein
LHLCAADGNFARVFRIQHGTFCFLSLLAIQAFSVGELRGGFADDWAKMERCKPKGYVAYRTVGLISIDGKLEESSWQDVPWTEYFADIEGDAKPQPPLRTRAKMLWDDEYFYIGAELEDPNVWATLTNRDSVIFQDNDFEVFIDPNGDNHEYYEFEMNALNTVWDLFLKKPYKDGGPALNEWDITGLKTAVHVRGTLNDPNDADQGWSVEIAFPWKALSEYAHRPAPPHHGDQWRVNFSRVEWRYEVVDGQYRKITGTKEDNWVWSPQGIVDMHRPEKWGYVQFSTGLAGTTKVKPDPSAGARELLHAIYYAEKDYQAKQGRPTVSLETLGLKERRCQGLIGTPKIQITPDGYWATVEIRVPGKEQQRWHIRQDAKVWEE